jgi:PAS domain S-box-containing protein
LRRQADVRKSSALGLFEALSEAIVVFDHAGLVVDLNPAAKHFFGYRLDQVKGKPASMMFDAGDLNAAQGAPAQCRNSRRSRLAVHASDGSSRMADAEVVKVASGDEGAAFWGVVIHRDASIEGAVGQSAIPGNSPLSEESRFAENHDFRILLIDDNVDANESMGSLLRLLDYDVRTAGDAESGLAAALEFEPHLILSDIGMPGMDGYALVPALRKAAGERKVVIAAATGYGLASDRARAHAAGFDHHLVKPLDADALLDFVAQQVASY